MWHIHQQTIHWDHVKPSEKKYTQIYIYTHIKTYQNHPEIFGVLAFCCCCCCCCWLIERQCSSILSWSPKHLTVWPGRILSTTILTLFQRGVKALVSHWSPNPKTRIHPQWYPFETLVFVYKVYDFMTTVFLVWGLAFLNLPTGLLIKPWSPCEHVKKTASREVKHRTLRRVRGFLNEASWTEKDQRQFLFGELWYSL